MVATRSCTLLEPIQIQSLDTTPKISEEVGVLNKKQLWKIEPCSEKTKTLKIERKLKNRYASKKQSTHIEVFSHLSFTSFVASLFKKSKSKIFSWECGGYALKSFPKIQSKYASIITINHNNLRLNASDQVYSWISKFKSNN